MIAWLKRRVVRALAQLLGPVIEEARRQSSERFHRSMRDDPAFAKAHNEQMRAWSREYYPEHPFSLRWAAEERSSGAERDD